MNKLDKRYISKYGKYKYIQERNLPLVFENIVNSMKVSIEHNESISESIKCELLGYIKMTEKISSDMISFFE